MNVREMIEVLSKFDQNLEVRITMNHEYESELDPNDFEVGPSPVTWHGVKSDKTCLYIGDVDSYWES